MDMQGKIGLEEHFAIPETLQDSAGFVPGDYWRELSSRLLDIHEGRLRQMDAHGMEMMILSLNAPAVQAVPDPKKACELAVRANDFLAEQVAQAARSLPGLRRLAHAGPGSGDAGTRALHDRARLPRCAGQRVLAGRHARQRRLLRRAAVRLLLGCGGAARRALLPASAQSAGELGADLRRPPVAARARPGPLHRRPPSTPCASWRAASSIAIRVSRSSWATWAKACPTTCGASITAMPGSRRPRAIRPSASSATTSTRTSTSRPPATSAPRR